MDYRGKERGHAAAKTICFQGCELGAGEISRIRAIVAKHAGATRRELAALVCREWDWRRANEEPRLCASRSFSDVLPLAVPPLWEPTSSFLLRRVHGRILGETLRYVAESAGG